MSQVRNALEPLNNMRSVPNNEQHEMETRLAEADITDITDLTDCDEYTINCFQCHKNFTDIDELEKHLQAHILENEENTIAKLFDCQICGRKLRSEWELIKHQNRFHAAHMIGPYKKHLLSKLPLQSRTHEPINASVRSRNSEAVFDCTNEELTRPPSGHQLAYRLLALTPAPETTAAEFNSAEQNEAATSQLSLAAADGLQLPNLGSPPITPQQQQQSPQEQTPQQLPTPIVNNAQLQYQDHGLSQRQQISVKVQLQLPILGSPPTSPHQPLPQQQQQMQDQFLPSNKLQQQSIVQLSYSSPTLGLPPTAPQQQLPQQYQQKQLPQEQTPEQLPTPIVNDVQLQYQDHRTSQRQQISDTIQVQPPTLGLPPTMLHQQLSQQYPQQQQQMQDQFLLPNTLQHKSLVQFSYSSPTLGLPSTAPQQQLPQQNQQQQLLQQYHQEVNQQQGISPNFSNAQQDLGFAQQQPIQSPIDLTVKSPIMSDVRMAPPNVVLHDKFIESINLHPSIMHCTLSKIPKDKSLLQQSGLLLGLVTQPFRDVRSLPVINFNNMVHCSCGTFINPFVNFVDSKRWQCNVCFSLNELPEDRQFGPVATTYGDVTDRRCSTVEIVVPPLNQIAPAQPAMYLFLFDISTQARKSGYLQSACSVLSRQLNKMPADERTQIGFICYDSFLHFYSMIDGANQPHEIILEDVDDHLLPNNLFVSLKSCMEQLKNLLRQLPNQNKCTNDSGSGLGAALQMAFKLMRATGGRITVFQTCLPNKGPGTLEQREGPDNFKHSTNFYKSYALEFASYEIAIDLFLMNQQHYNDMATLSGLSKYSGGCLYHFPLYQETKQHIVDSFKGCFTRYLTRNIGFEAKMHLRCTHGLQLETFHGNYFERRNSLVSLPNVNPDSAYGMEISYEQNVLNVSTICFQTVLLYTNSQGERRLRVHTLCQPVTDSLPEVLLSANEKIIVSLLSKMAVRRLIATNLDNARATLIKAINNIYQALKVANLYTRTPPNLAKLPAYILALLKHPAFSLDSVMSLDYRICAMDCMTTLPLDEFMNYIYPKLYNLDALIRHVRISKSQLDTTKPELLPVIPRLQLSAKNIDARSLYLMDCGKLLIIYVGINVRTDILQDILGIRSTSDLSDHVYGLPNVISDENDALRLFILRIISNKPYPPVIKIIKDTSLARAQFIDRLTDDCSANSFL